MRWSMLLMCLSLACHDGGTLAVVQPVSETCEAEGHPEVWRTQLPAIRLCYSELLRRRPNAEGLIYLSYRTDLGGDATEVSVERDDIQDETLSECLIELSEAAHFPSAIECARQVHLLFLPEPPSE